MLCPYFSEVKDSELSGASTNSTEDGSLPSISLVKKQFAGRYAISSEEFTSEMVRNKSQIILGTYFCRLNICKCSGQVFSSYYELYAKSDGPRLELNLVTFPTSKEGFHLG